jgi:hypothetical protein
VNAVAASRLRMMLAAGKARLARESAVVAWQGRMKRRDERRAREGWTPEQIARGSRYIKTRPSDGQPVGSKHFDMEEYQTRKKDARAADPETFERERHARRVAINQYWDHIRFERAHSNASKEIAEVLPKDRLERYRDIWQVITQSILAKRWLIINAGQVQLYHLRKKQPRVRGVGRAAKLAGF